VDQAFAGIRRGRHPGRLQALGVEHAVVPQRVELGDGDQSLRQPAEIRRQQWHGIGRRFAWPTQVQRQVALGVGCAEQWRVDAVAAGRQVGGAAQAGVDQDLRQGLRLMVIPQAQTQGSRQVTARTVTGHHQTLKVDVTRRFTRLNRPPDRVAIVEGGRERMFGGQPVINGDHQHLQSVGQLTADKVVGIQATHHPAATVHIKDAWPAGIGRGCRGLINAYAHATEGTV